MDFCNLEEIYLTDIRKTFEYCYKSWNRCCKNCFQKIVHKTAEATGDLRGIKTAEKIVKAKPVPDENLRNVKEINIPPEKREKK